MVINSRYKLDGKSVKQLNSLQQETKLIIEKNILEGIYELEFLPCPICNNSDEFDVLSEKDSYGFRCNVIICKTCGLIQLNPRMNYDAYNNFYEKYYSQIMRDKQLIDNQHKNKKEKEENVYSII